MLRSRDTAFVNAYTHIRVRTTQIPRLPRSHMPIRRCDANVFLLSRLGRHVLPTFPRRVQAHFPRLIFRAISYLLRSLQTFAYDGRRTLLLRRIVMEKKTHQIRPRIRLKPMVSKTFLLKCPVKLLVKCLFVKCFESVQACLTCLSNNLNVNGV